MTFFENFFQKDLFFFQNGGMITLLSIVEEVKRLPNIKSAKKRVLVSEKKAETNKAFVTTVKTTAKKFDKALEEGNKEAAQAAYKAAVKKIDTAVSKCYVHKNTAARKKSQMTKKLNAAE